VKAWPNHRTVCQLMSGDEVEKVRRKKEKEERDKIKQESEERKKVAARATGKASQLHTENAQAKIEVIE